MILDSYASNACVHDKKETAFAFGWPVHKKLYVLTVPDHDFSSLSKKLLRNNYALHSKHILAICKRYVR